MTPHGPWKIVASQEVYRDPWIQLRKDDVIRPDGHAGTFSVVHLKAGVTVLAMDDAGNVFLTEEFHYGVGRTTLECVSGGIEAGEDSVLTAQREMREELGIEARRWDDLGVVDPFTSSIVSPTRLYVARELRFGTQELEGTERIRCVKLSLTEAVAAVMDGRITHAPSGVLILKTRLMFPCS
ncbi:MAG: NUDIX hydrolase [Gemmataceae bacterium]|nr:NUDIX hydrolase [Gemmataceae bacterium]